MASELDRLLDQAGELSAAELPIARLEAGARRRAAALEDEAPRFRRRVNRGLFALGGPVLAIYRTLIEELGREPEGALALVDELLQASYRRRLRSPLRRAAMGAFHLPVVRKAALRAVEGAGDEPGGFVMRGVEGTDDLLALDVVHCPLAVFFAEQRAPELGPLICKIDDLMAEALPGVTLIRTGTIAAGAKRCDFRYRKG